MADRAKRLGSDKGPLVFTGAGSGGFSLSSAGGGDSLVKRKTGGRVQDVCRVALLWIVAGKSGSRCRVFVWNNSSCSYLVNKFDSCFKSPDKIFFFVPAHNVGVCRNFKNFLVCLCTACRRVEKFSRANHSMQVPSGPPSRFCSYMCRRRTGPGPSRGIGEEATVTELET